MSAKTLARDRYTQRATLARRTAVGMQRLWSQVDTANISESWLAQLPQAIRLMILAQRLSAVEAQQFVAAISEAQGATPAPIGTVLTTQIAGTASDGRSLATLLQLPAITVKMRLSRGYSLDQAMVSGLSQLVSITGTQVADAGRSSDYIAITNDRSITGYVRELAGDSCSRCIILAGKYFRWNTGFQRHPRCDCYHVPATTTQAAGHDTTDPKAVFNSLPTSEQDRIFGSDAQAIRDGADINRVVNARRGMTSLAQQTEALKPTTVTRLNRDIPEVARVMGASSSLEQQAAAAVQAGDSAAAAAFRDQAKVLRQAAAHMSGVPTAGNVPDFLINLAAGDRDVAIQLLTAGGYLA